MSRRNQITMEEAEINEFLRASKTIILVSNGKNGYPHPMPMWYAIDDDDRIIMTTFRKSQKVKNIQRDNKVALLVESGTAYQELKSALIYANAEVIDDTDAVADTMHRVGLFRGDITAEQASSPNQMPASQAAKRVKIRFEPVSVVSWDHTKLGGVY